MSKTFTLEVQTNAENAGYSARDGLHVYTMPDDWTSEMIAKQAAKDHEKTATDDSWRIVVWNGDATQDQLRDPDWVVYGHELAGDCWCHPFFIHDGEYEWYCPSHGDRSWRPAAKAFQASLTCATCEAVSENCSAHISSCPAYQAKKAAKLNAATGAALDRMLAEDVMSGPVYVDCDRCNAVTPGSIHTEVGDCRYAQGMFAPVAEGCCAVDGPCRNGCVES